MLPEAYDVDAEPFNVVKYQLTNDDEVMTSHDNVTPTDGELPFRLESARRDDSLFDLRLVVTRSLDREVLCATYSLSHQNSRAHMR